MLTLHHLLIPKTQLMPSISDNVSKRVNSPNARHIDIVKLRYFSDYGHGFLGLFRALAEGRFEEVVNDPGPPFIAPEHIPILKRTLLRLAKSGPGHRAMPKKYAAEMKSLPPLKVSYDSLFE